MRDLSVIIPARQETYAARTVQDALEHAQADTEVILVLDGAWADPPLPDHPRVVIVHLSESIGQRAATNLGARVSQARYVCKLDAHCGVADGFDVALIQAAKELGRKTIQVPTQYNWQIFERVCSACGHHAYQGPTNVPCDRCKQPGAYMREMVWKRRERHKTMAWCFDADLKFGYFKSFERSQRGRGDLTETMSCLGAFWFLDREWFWKLGGLDEGHGSWGQMGTELSCKAWLSGGRLITNQRTWYGHAFRTQGGDWSFPYPISHSQQEHAREYSRALWRNNRWVGQVRPLSWLVERFSPVPGWTDDALASALEQGVAFARSRSVTVPERGVGRVALAETGVSAVAAELVPMHIDAQGVSELAGRRITEVVEPTDGHAGSYAPLPFGFDGAPPANAAVARGRA